MTSGWSSTDGRESSPSADFNVSKRSPHERSDMRDVTRMSLRSSGYLLVALREVSALWHNAHGTPLQVTVHQSGGRSHRVIS